MDSHPLFDKKRLLLADRALRGMARKAFSCDQTAIVPTGCSLDSSTCIGAPTCPWQIVILSKPVVPRGLASWPSGSLRGALSPTIFLISACYLHFGWRVSMAQRDRALVAVVNSLVRATAVSVQPHGRDGGHRRR